LSTRDELITLWARNRVYKLIDTQKAINSFINGVIARFDSDIISIFVREGTHMAPDALNHNERQARVLRNWRKIPYTGQLPTYVQAPPLGEWVIQFLDRLLLQIESLGGVNRTSQGQSIPGIEAAAAMERLQVADKDGMAIISAQVERALPQVHEME